MFYFVGAEFEVGEVREGLEVLDLRYPVLDEVEVGQVREGLEVLDVFEFVVAEVETAELRVGFQAGEVFDEVVVEFELFELGCEEVRELDFGYGVLAQAEAAELLEAFEAKGWYGGYARVLGVDFFGFGVFIV